MELVAAILGIVVILLICIFGLLMLASVITIISAFGEAYDDLHSEEEYFENYKAKR